VGEKYFNMAKRKNTEMLVVFCDLNRFKDINDSYGHKEGDEALKQTAMILKTAFRNYDIVSRFGGDEFVLLLDNTTASDFQSLKKRLDTALAAYNDSSGKKYRISISYGFSSFKYDRNPALTFDDLLDEADKMLYAEKRKKPEFAKRPRHSKRPVKMPTP
jgi:diguanylate cyclase (GGDEF)-like protein